MRATRTIKIILVALVLSSPAMARHKEGDLVLLDFVVYEGLPIIQVQTSIGNLRLLADTGSNATTLDKTSPPQKLVIKVRRYAVEVKPYPTQTVVFAQFNAAVPKEQRLDGVVGQDFFSQFSTVTFDYVHRRILLGR